MRRSELGGVKPVTLHIIAFVGAALLASPAFARLGETEAQIQARYGTPTDMNSDGAALPAKRQKFHFKDFTIVVSFVDGKSVCEVIWKTGYTKLDADEINGLLAANATRGQTWKRDSSGFWRRSDHGAVGQYVGGTVEVYTTEWDRKLNRTLDALHAEKTKGF